MHYMIFLISAFLLGCLAAVPAGPVQLEVVRRAVNGHMKSSLMVVVGAFFADVFYGSIAFFGIAPILENERVMAIFWLAGGLILTVLGILIIKHSLREQDVTYTPDHLKRKRWAFLGGLSLSATNPMMILWWLTGVRIFTDVGLIENFTSDIALSFLAAGSLGLAAYLSLLSFFIYWAKKFISLKTLQKVNMGFGIILLLIAGYFIYTSFHAVLRIY